MRNNNQNGYNLELLAYTFFAVLSVCTVLYLFYYSPVNYALLITEDHIAEYGTSVSFGLAGIILLSLSFIRGPKVRRVMWILIGVMALLIAAEEISWGQRIFYVETPGIISEHNLQEEVTLHNLVAFDSVNKKLHVIVSYLILMYLVFSMVVLVSMPGLKEKLTDIGLPLIQIRLVPVFLLAPYFFIFFPTAKADEIGELFLGIAVLMWAVDLFLISIKSKRFDSFASVLIMTGVLFLAVIISGGLTYRHSPGLTARLNLMASRDYPDFEMYEQAQNIYSYIYQHPQYLTPETRLNHARMLQVTGKNSEAARILSEAARDIEAKEPLKTSNSKQLRLLGITYMLLAQNTLADNYFDKSIEIDQNALSLSPTPDEKAKALWSISKTMEARGNISGAITNIEQAIKSVHSPALHYQLEEQLKELRRL